MGAFNGDGGHGGLYFLPKDETMKSEDYMLVLRDIMLPSYELHGCNMFMNDGAPCHQAKKGYAMAEKSQNSGY